MRAVNETQGRYEGQERYEKSNAWGISCSVDVKNCNPLRISDPEIIRQYVYELCDLIEMKRFGECQVVNFGEDEKVAGYSMVQLIETSLISGHFANASGTAYIDIFSCKYYDPEVVKNFTLSFFEGESATCTPTLRF